MPTVSSFSTAAGSSKQARHDELMALGGVYNSLMAEQAARTERVDTSLKGDGTHASEGSAQPTYCEEAQFRPTDAIVKAEGLGWFAAAGELLKHIGPYRRSLIMTILFGVTRVLAFIGVGVFGALAVKAVKAGEPFETFPDFAGGGGAGCGHLPLVRVLACA